MVSNTLNKNRRNHSSRSHHSPMLKFVNVWCKAESSFSLNRSLELTINLLFNVTPLEGEH